MKLAIISPGFVPVPAVNGGAIEQLITYMINANENIHKYDIDLYTVDDPKLSGKVYKYTNLVKVAKTTKEMPIRIFFSLKNRIVSLLHLQFNDNFFDYKISKAYKTNYYDAVLVENNMNIYANILKKVTNEKVYFHLHNDFNCGDYAKTKEKTKKIIETADKILVVSNFLRQKLIKLGANKDKVKVVYNSLILDNFRVINNLEKNKIRKRYGLSSKDIVFTFVGRLTPDKGIDKLLLALNILKNESNIKCLIVGHNFFGSKTESKYIKKLRFIAENIKDKIVFTGYIPNSKLYEIYSISNCVVMPSQFEEVFGVVALEAMTMGVPVIASKSGGLPEVLDDSCAIFVNRGESFISNYAKSILKIAKNPNLRKKMGAAGKTKSKQFKQNEEEYFKDIYKNLE